MKWKIIDTGRDSPERVMQKDRDLLSGLGSEEDPVLHFYDWEGPSATYGVLFDPDTVFSREGLEKAGLRIAKRPTGGGVIFHLWDWAFSAAVPASCKSFSSNTLENYAFINTRVLAAVEEFASLQGCNLIEEEAATFTPECNQFCMAKPTRYDVVSRGKKIAGAAQRKTRDGFLHQGSISLLMPSLEILDTVLLPEIRVSEAMRFFTYPLLGEDSSFLEEKKQEIRKLMIKHFMRDDI